MSIRHTFLAFLLLALMLVACSSGGSDPDGDAPDGDQSDGDSDGDEPDGDDPDGDDPDGDDPDGDEPDGDTDGDADGDTDGDVDGDDEFVYPDHTFIHELRNVYPPVTDTLYQEEQAFFYRTTEQLPVLDVRDLAWRGGELFAATADGLFVLRQDAENFVAILDNGGRPDATPLALVDIAAHSNDPARIWTATQGSVWSVAVDGTSAGSLDFQEGDIRAVEVIEGTVLVGSEAGLFMAPDTLDAAWEPVPDTDDWVVNGLSRGPDGLVYAATEDGLYAVNLQTSSIGSWSFVDLGTPQNSVSRFVAVATCGDKVAALGENALFVLDPDDLTSPTIFRAVLDGGLPTGNNLTLSCTDSAAVIGHAIGASHIPFDGSDYDHYGLGRWLPYRADAEGQPSFLRVPATALAGDGTRWLGSAYGISRIDLVSRRLADKEVAHDAMVPWFWRLGGFFASDGNVANPWADPATMTLWDKDNDGLWTQMMIGGWCYAYAATGDERYYEYARRGMDNMFKLIDFPAITFAELGKPRGFIARSFVSEDEGAPYTSKIEQAERVTGKEILRWNPITVDGVNYLWKADTSSDEIAGHNFGFPVFYDLCAKDDAERAEVARYMTDMMGYIVDHDFELIDMDGTKTLHGHWNPDRISIAVDGLGACLQAGHPVDLCGEAYYGGGWLNSLQILGGLLAAWHVSGEERFYDAYEYLIREHRYDEVAMAGDNTYTITRRSIANHSDHELAMLAYTTLIRYEPSDERRARWIESLEFLYDWERPERNPWWTAICALSGCSDPSVENAVRTLRELPDDRRTWGYDLVYRTDHASGGNDRFGRPQLDRVLPYDEIRTMWWNGNPYARSSGGNGREWSAPTTFLLPYYMHLYAGTVIPEE